ncbi:MAG: DJ-1/PfpI family protein [Acidobacteriota bacterium]
MKQGLLMTTAAFCLGLIACTSSAQPQSQNPTRQVKGTRNLAILIFEGVQIIDYTGPYEVFGGVYVDGARAFNVYTVSEKTDAITTAMGMSVNPKYSFENAPKPDVLLIPGGGGSKPGAPGVGGVLANPRTIKWVADNAKDAELVMSVCNGAFIIHKAGLLEGLTATTTAGLIDLLAETAKNTKVVRDKRFVDNGKVITAAGLSSGIDGALHVVEKLFGRGQAQMSALGIEYNWDPESKYARAALADRYMRFVYDVQDATPVSREGTTDRWENKWLVAGESASEILGIVNDSLANAKTYGPPMKSKWARQDAGDKDATKSLWKFTDENAKTWTGVASVQPVQGETKKFLLSVRIARNDSGS